MAHTLANIAIFSVSTNVLPDKPLWLDDPRRPLRASASVVTSIRVDRYEHLRRSLRASASVDANDKSLTFYLLLFYSFTFKDMLLWGRGMGKMPIPPTFYLLLFYFFTFKDMLLWGRGMGKMPIPPTFYSFTFSK